jgi:hypothetical protein
MPSAFEAADRLDGGPRPGVAEQRWMGILGNDRVVDINDRPDASGDTQDARFFLHWTSGSVAYSGLLDGRVDIGDRSSLGNRSHTRIQTARSSGDHGGSRVTGERCLTQHSQSLYGAAHVATHTVRDVASQRNEATACESSWFGSLNGSKKQLWRGNDEFSNAKFMGKRRIQVRRVRWDNLSLHSPGPNPRFSGIRAAMENRLSRRDAHRGRKQ